jgi:hypothetical protein
MLLSVIATSLGLVAPVRAQLPPGQVPLPPQPPPDGGSPPPTDGEAPPPDGQTPPPDPDARTDAQLEAEARAAAAAAVAAAAERARMWGETPGDAVERAITPDPSSPPRNQMYFPLIFTAPSGRMLPAAVIWSSSGVHTGGGFYGDLFVGLGDVAEFGVGVTDLIRVRPAPGEDPIAVEPFAPDRVHVLHIGLATIWQSAAIMDCEQQSFVFRTDLPILAATA